MVNAFLTALGTHFVFIDKSYNAKLHHDVAPSVLTGRTTVARRFSKV